PARGTEKPGALGVTTLNFATLVLLVFLTFTARVACALSHRIRRRAGSAIPSLLGPIIAHSPSLYRPVDARLARFPTLALVFAIRCCTRQSGFEPSGGRLS